MDAEQEFDQEFQAGILSLMYRDSNFLSYASDNLYPNFFTDKEMSLLFSYMRANYLDTRSLITKRTVIDKIKSGIRDGHVSKERVKYIKGVFEDIESDALTDAGYIRDRIVDFTKRNLMREAFVKAHAVYESGSYSDISRVFIEAYQKSDITSKLGQTYPDPEGYLDRVSRRETNFNTIPTGILELDNYLRGNGLGEKELGVVLAPTNRGKSMFLKHIAEFNMLRGLRGLIFTLEMSEDRYLDRFDMSLNQMTSSEMSNQPEKIQDKLKNMCGDSSTGKVHIKEFPSQSATVDTLRSYTENLRRTGFFPDFIVVDYADLLGSVVSYTEERHVRSHIYKRIRGWAVEDSIPIWTASQANRASLSKSQITIEDIAEDFGKAQIADVIIGLCQNKKEKEQEEMRFFLAKNRDGTSGIEVSANTDFSHAKFFVG